MSIQKLEIVKQTLKKEFFGLNSQIDKIINLITPWYIDQPSFNKPIIVNLWGITGSGKTTLVRRLVELLENKNIYCEIDLGRYTSEKEDFLRQIQKLSNKKSIFLFDEIQAARTVNQGIEIDRPALRSLWSLLSDGKVISPIYGDFIMDDLFNIFLDTDENDLSFNSLNEDISVEILNRFNIDLRDFRYKKLSTLKGKEFIKYIVSEINNESSQKMSDFSKSLIFISGNFDEAFTADPHIDYDSVDINEMSESSKKINKLDIRKALHNRFRPDQIARFGSNHVIFTSLNLKEYSDLINHYFNQTKDIIKLKSDVHVNFSPNLIDPIIEEGVVPTQGIRAIQSAYESLINSQVPYIVEKSLSTKCDTVNISYNNLTNSLSVSFIKEGLSVCEVNNFEFELNKSANEVLTDQHSEYVAYHEAGHAIVGYLIKNELPTKIRAKTADSNTAGLVTFNLPKLVTKKTILEDIIITLGGLAAEKLIFGEENVSIFSNSDLQYATKEASDMIRRYGMGTYLAVSLNSVDNPENATSFQDKDDKDVEDILQYCYAQAEDLLAMNLEFHEEVANILKKQSHLSPNEFEKIALKHLGENK